MKLDEIRPVVHSVTPRRYLPERKWLVRARRCELLYVQEGAGEVRFGTKRAVPFSAGSVMLVPPGAVYVIRTQGEAVYGLNVSFDYDEAAGEAPRFEDAACLNEPLLLEGVPDMDEYLPAMMQVFLRKEPHWQMHLSSGVQIILVRLVRYADGGMHSLIGEVIDLVTKRYMEPLNNADIASELGYHPNYVNAVFVRDMGMSLHQYLMRYRVEMATHLLLTTSQPISAIAEQVGFRHFSHFSNCFHRLTGVTPAVYRAER